MIPTIKTNAGKVTVFYQQLKTFALSVVAIIVKAMPHASELEEFGLEVEREHHALISSGGAESPSAAARRHHHPLSTPSKEQRSLLQTVNARPSSRLLKPGILKWAALVLALAVAVFLHLGR